MFIYALRDPRSQHGFAIRYVGRTKNSLKKRLAEHVSDKNPCHRVNWIQSLLREGIKPDICILEECREDVWRERETWWIRHYRKLGCDLTNANDGGDGMFCPTPEMREKMSNASRGRIVSLETRKKLSAINMGRPSPQKGIPLSEETKRKIGDAQRGEKNHRFGKKNTPAQIAGIVAAVKGVPRSPEVRAKLSISKRGEKNPMYGKPVSQEHRDKISRANKGHKSYPMSKEGRERVSAARRGKKLSFETRLKLSESQRGKVISQEQRAKISAANKGRKRTPEQIARSVKAKKEARQLRKKMEMTNQLGLFHV